MLNLEYVSENVLNFEFMIFEIMLLIHIQTRIIFATKTSLMMVSRSLLILFLLYATSLQALLYGTHRVLSSVLSLGNRYLVTTAGFLTKVTPIKEHFLFQRSDDLSFLIPHLAAE